MRDYRKQKCGLLAGSVPFTSIEVCTELKVNQSIKSYGEIKKEKFLQSAEYSRYFLPLMKERNYEEDFILLES